METTRPAHIPYGHSWVCGYGREHLGMCCCDLHHLLRRATDHVAGRKVEESQEKRARSDSNRRTSR